MKYTQLPKELYIKNRAKLVKHLDAKAIAVFNSNDVLPTNADGHLPLVQNTDLFYMSGVDQEETILVVCPHVSRASWREILFVKETNEEIAIWEGAKLNKEQATEVSGVKTVMWLSQFESVFNALMAQSESVYINTNEHLRAHVEVETRDARFIKKLRLNYPGHPHKRLAPIMHDLRSVKEPEEISQMQKACDITKAGVERILKFIKPGVLEYEIEAELSHEFLKRGSRGFAYTPIIASGSSACVLHYIQNDQACKDGDVILMDVGAEYGNYASDLTRSVPVNGKFTKRQKDVYNSVLSVMKGAMEILRPGILIDDYHREVGLMMQAQLLKLGLLDQHDIDKQNPDMPAYKKYFMHGTSHHIGLDVHDYGHYHKPVQENNVFTVEPGIYIREEGLGIRLENDIVIHNGGITDLMSSIPLTVDEIEDAMHS
ncbi:MAG: aminopeptidase P family protein [Flavobacteriales bacterium]